MVAGVPPLLRLLGSRVEEGRRRGRCRSRSRSRWRGWGGSWAWREGGLMRLRWGGVVVLVVVMEGGGCSAR